MACPTRKDCFAKQLLCGVRERFAGGFRTVASFVVSAAIIEVRHLSGRDHDKVMLVHEIRSLFYLQRRLLEVPAHNVHRVLEVAFLARYTLLLNLDDWHSIAYCVNFVTKPI